MQPFAQLLKKFPSILWTTEIHCRVHNSPLLVPNLSQINTVHTTLTSLRSILIFSSHLWLGLSSCFILSGYGRDIVKCCWSSSAESFFLPKSRGTRGCILHPHNSDFPTKSLYVFLFSPCVLHALPNSSSWLDHSSYIWRRVQVMKKLC
jgi:hypothetical protein